MPMIICDGHDSRLQLTFLEYIGAEDTKWDVCLGVPYGTHLWQVADSSEQNGMFKMRWIKEKAKLITYKSKHNLPLTLNATDIMPLTSKAWEASFAVPSLVRKAVADRGWNPLNFALLINPEILGTKRAQEQASKVTETNSPDSSITDSNSSTVVAKLKCKEGSNIIIEINVGRGTAKHCMSTLVEMALRSGGLENRGEELVTGEQIRKDLSNLSKWTSGHLVKLGHHCLSTIEILQAARERAEQKRNKEVEQTRNRRKKQRAFEEAMNTIAIRIAEKPELDFNRWSATDCKRYLQYYKTDKDPKMPSKICELRAHCCVVRDEKRPQRPLPSLVADESDDEHSELDFGFI